MNEVQNWNQLKTARKQAFSLCPSQCVFDWSNNRMSIGQMNRSKTNLITMYRSPPKTVRPKDNPRQLRLTCHLELRDEQGSWGFKAEEGDSQDKKGKCLVIRWLTCYTDRSFWLQSCLLAVASFLGQAPYLNSLTSFKEEVKVSLESAGSWLPSAQNSARAKGAHFGGDLLWTPAESMWRSGR